MVVKRVLLLVLFGIVLLFAVDKDKDAALLPGDPAPMFFLRQLDENDFFLSRRVGDRARPGKKSPIVLSFFTNACIPCRKEIPHLTALQEEYTVPGIYLVNVGDDVDMVKKYVTKMKYNLPVLLDKYGMIAEKYKAEMTPTLVIISEEGKILFYKQGFEDGDEKIISAKMKELFGEKEAETPKE